MNKKTIGIIGGAGPMAGTLLTKKIIANCQKYGCCNDVDFPKLILLSFPFAEMLKPNTTDQKELVVERQLKEALDFLIDSGAEYLGIACNTLHGFLNDSYEDQLINLIEETRLYLTKKRFSKVLVLCTSTSALKNIHNFFSNQLPNKKNQQLIDEIIRAVLTGNFSLQESKQLKTVIVSELEKDPTFDGILLGCSELSVLLNEFPIEIPGVTLIDPLDILSKKYVN